MSRPYTWLAGSAALVALLALQGCSSDNGLNAASTSSTSDLLASLDAILDSDSTSTSSKLDALHKGEVGDFSPAGCQYRQEVARARLEMGRVSVPICFIKAAEDTGAFSLPQESYGVFKIIMPQGMEENDGEFLVRMGVFTSEGKKSLKMQNCKAGNQKENFVISETDDGVRVATQHVFSDSQGAFTFSGGNSLVITASGSTDNITNANLMARFNGSDGGSYSNEGNIDFTHSSDGNSMLGCFNGVGGDPMGNTFAHQGCSCTVAKNGTGATHVKGTDEFPSFLNPFDSKKYCPAGFDAPPVETLSDTCSFTYDDSQAFSIVDDSPLIADSSTSAFIAEVSGCDLDQSIEAPTTFEEAWDCSGDTTTIDFTNIDVDECVALDAKLEAAQEKLNDNCFDQEQQQG